jgi:hypothetical protein
MVSTIAINKKTTMTATESGREVARMGMHLLHRKTERLH